MYFKQIMMDEMGSLSYLIGCPETKVACVINPKVDIDEYIDAANYMNMKITHIFETSGYVGTRSGDIELQSLTGADIYYLEENCDKISTFALIGGERFEFGNAVLEINKCNENYFFESSISVTDKSNRKEPWLMLTRESLFVKDIADPDINGQELADELTEYLDFHGNGYNFPPVSAGNSEKSFRQPLGSPDMPGLLDCSTC